MTPPTHAPTASSFSTEDISAHRHLWSNRVLIASGTAIMVIIAALGWAALSGEHDGPAAPAAGIDRAHGEAPVGLANQPHEGAQIHLRAPGSAQTRTCTLGPILDPRSAVTAAHCGDINDLVSLRTDTAPIGSITERRRGQDLAMITFDGDLPDSVVSTLAVDDVRANEPLAKYGAATGRSTGTIASPTPRTYRVRSGSGPETRVTAISAHLCAAAGDSGAPVYRTGTNEIIGIVIAVENPQDCSTIISPLISR